MVHAVKSAKIIGILILLFGLYDSVGVINVVSAFSQSGNSFLGEDIFALCMMMISPLTALVVGYGLYRSKLWAVYGLGILAIVRILLLVWASSEATITPGNVVVVGIYSILFLWFFSNKKLFSK